MDGITQSGLPLTSETIGATQEISSPECLFASHYAAITRAVTLVTGDIDSARDCVQEAFLRLCRNWEDVRQFKRKELWVRQVAVNIARDERRARRRRLVLLERIRALPVGPPSPSGDPHLWAAVGQLPARQRLALGLYYLGGFKISEVSDAMGISEGAVKKHLDRARASLRNKMEVE